MEQRHQQEFASPTVAQHPEQMNQLEQRQESEHQTLQHNYQQARSTGAEHMPSAPAPRAEPARAPSPPPAQHHK